MMTSMDFRFPELSAPRDPRPDSVSRTREHADTDFADYLDSSMRDRQVDEPRETKVREAAPRKAPSTHDERDSNPARDPSDIDEKHDDAVASVEPAKTPTPQPAETVEKIQAVETIETPIVTEAGVSVADIAPSMPDQGAAETPAPVAAQNAALASAPAVPLPPVAPVQGAASAPAQPSRTNPLGAPNPPAQQPPMQAAPANDAVTAPAPEQNASPTQPPTFAGELAVATARTNDPAPASSKSQSGAKPSSSTDQSAAPAADSQVTIPASVAKASAPSGESGRESQDSGDRSFAKPQPTQPQAPVSVPTADEADVAQIATLPHPAQAPAKTASRPTDTALPPAAPADLPTAETVLDVAPAATPPEHAKPDAPSRPFANVAPGLTVAAQATAQQTPEQASAAERLAQLVSAKESEAASAADAPGNDAMGATENPTTPARLEQTPQADVAAPRNMTVDAASAAASARHARPTFHPLVAQVAVHVAQAAADGNDRISIRLSPAELGRIDVRLDFGPDGRVQAVFAADRPQTVELLQRDARDLERALQDAGLRADSGSLSFNLRGDGRNNSPAFAEAAATTRRDDPVAEIPLPQIQAYAAGSAAPGRLDIRI